MAKACAPFVLADGTFFVLDNAGGLHAYRSRRGRLAAYRCPGGPTQCWQVDTFQQANQFSRCLGGRSRAYRAVVTDMAVLEGQATLVDTGGLFGDCLANEHGQTQPLMKPIWCCCCLMVGRA